jgi:hypothetical protein
MVDETAKRPVFVTVEDQYGTVQYEVDRADWNAMTPAGRTRMLDALAGYDDADDSASWWIENKADEAATEG